MKLLKRLLISLTIFLFLFFVCASMYVHFYGKKYIEGALQKAFNRDVAIENISFQLPLSLRAKNITIAHVIEGKKFFEVQDIIARLSINAIFRRQLVFDLVELIKPVVSIEKSVVALKPSDLPMRGHDIKISPDQSNSEVTNAASGDNGNQNKKTEIFIKQLILRQGRFQYANSSINKDFSFAMEDVDLTAEHLMFPVKAGRTQFNVLGRLVKKGNPLSGSSVEGHGWVDIVQRDMEVSVKVVEADGSAGMTAEAISKNNDMEVKGEIKFQNILMGSDRDDSTEASTVVNNLISSALSSAGVEIGAKFSFKTKMDDFHPEQVSFSGNVVTK